MFQPLFAASRVAIVAGLLLAGCGRKETDPMGMGEMPPWPVVAVEVHPEVIEVHATYPGRIRGMREVEIRSRVSGILEERLYTEGQSVEKGSAMFRIEPDPYVILLRQAEAELANARATVNQAEREWRRVTSLFEQAIASERERDGALSDLELAQAQWKLAEARVAEAGLNLDYTTITAPIGGPTGLESLSEGSLIERGALLTTVVQDDPVQVRFSLPERDAVLWRAAGGAGGDGAVDNRREVHLLFPDGTRSTRVGHVDFTDSTVDPRTGSVQARAVFDNPERALIPGQFVRVQLTLQTLENVFAVHPAAVVEGQAGPSVFLVGPDNTAQARSVRLGRMVEGRRVILAGLEAGDRLVVSGLVMLQPGMPVAVLNQENGGE